MDVSPDLPSTADPDLAARRAAFAFLGAWGHEFTTPVSGILGFSALLRDGKLPPDKQPEILDLLLFCAQFLKMIHTNFFQVARIESGWAQVERTPFDPRECVERVREGLAALAAGRREAQLAVRIDPRTPTRLLGNSSFVVQALFNIIDDAIQSAQEGTLITIMVGPHEVDDAELLFTVAYASAPNVPSHQERLTQIFRRTDNWPPWMALELALSRRLCELLGGRIWVEGDDRAVRVQFTVPAIPKEGPG